MSDPLVSFVVPCFKLAHLLPECVNSILSQTCRDFEILILDDCSPDNTAEVARSFKDPRVTHIRNDPNLGSLRNYNKGIGLARGKYVWLISADDYLRRPYVLQRSVELLESHPRVGYTFCSGVGVRNGRETETLAYATYGDRDQVVPGHAFVEKLLDHNIVLAASGLARRECYEKISLFPLDMPWAGDWYLWSVFALFWDVGYLAEPMICYREHELSMTTQLQQFVESRLEEDLAVRWRVGHKAEAAGFRRMARACLEAVAKDYARFAKCKLFDWAPSHMTLEKFEESLQRNTTQEADRAWIRAWVFMDLGDAYGSLGDSNLAREFYRRSHENNPWMAKLAAKRLLLALGRPGDSLRRMLRSARGTNAAPRR